MEEIKICEPFFCVCRICGEYTGMVFRIFIGDTYISNKDSNELFDELYRRIANKKKLVEIRKCFDKLVKESESAFLSVYHNRYTHLQDEFDILEDLCDECALSESDFLLEELMDSGTAFYTNKYAWKAYLNHGMFGFNRHANYDLSDMLKTIRNSMSDLESGCEICGSSHRHCGPIGVSGWATTWMHSKMDVWSCVNNNGVRYATQVGSEDHDEYWFSDMKIDTIWVKDWYLSKAPIEIRQALRSLAKEIGVKFKVIGEEISDYDYKRELSKDDARLKMEERLIEYYETLL